MVSPARGSRGSGAVKGSVVCGGGDVTLRHCSGPRVSRRLPVRVRELELSGGPPLRKLLSSGLVAAAGVALLVLSPANDAGGGRVRDYVDESRGVLDARSLRLHDAGCDGAGDGAGGWFFDDSDRAPGASLRPARAVVPGDALVRTCRFVLEVVGKDMFARVRIEPDVGAGMGWARRMPVTTSYTVGGDSAVQVVDDSHDGEVLEVTMRLRYPLSSRRGSGKKGASPAVYQVLLTQVPPPAP